MGWAEWITNPINKSKGYTQDHGGKPGYWMNEGLYNNYQDVGPSGTQGVPGVPDSISTYDNSVQYWRDKKEKEREAMTRWALENPTQRRARNERELPKDNWWGHKMGNSQQRRLENKLWEYGYDVNSVYDNTRGQSDPNLSGHLFGPAGAEPYYGPRDIADFYETFLGQDMRNLIN